MIKVHGVSIDGPKSLLSLNTAFVVTIINYCNETEEIAFCKSLQDNNVSQVMKCVPVCFEESGKFISDLELCEFLKVRKKKEKYLI